MAKPNQPQGSQYQMSAINFNDNNPQSQQIQFQSHPPQQQQQQQKQPKSSKRQQYVDQSMNQNYDNNDNANANDHKNMYKPSKKGDKSTSKRRKKQSDAQSSSFWNYNRNNGRYSTRLIERGSGSHPNVIIKGRVHSYLYLYHSIIDTPWLKLFFYGFLLFFLFNLFFGTLFHLIDGVIWNGEPEKHVTWSDAFFFTLQSMDTIGFGALIPNKQGGNWLVFFMSYASAIFWTAFTGIVFAKLSRPSRLKRQFKFSNVAVINYQMESFIPKFFDNLPAPHEDDDDEVESEYAQRLKELDGARWSEYGRYGVDEKYAVLQFRFGDMRHTSRICDSDFHLLFFQRSTRNDDKLYEDYVMEEMDYDINRQRGRVRSLNASNPLLSLPWVVVHKIDKLSPLYGLSKQDMMDRKCEIIAVVDGIDEATSDNFQSWWSFTPNEIYWNYTFKPMVKAVVRSNKQFLQIDYDRISMITPMSSSLNSKENVALHSSYASSLDSRKNASLSMTNVSTLDSNKKKKKGNDKSGK
mmetsp:Transcript_39512/g.63208  ORF Transcript_39512/g.63208 Transcript_39512/m.63208 type:complete len:522 (+) Transcript_39512:32-1597(+)